MGKRRKGEDIHGWVILDKPLDITSTQAVSAVRRLFNARKAGHAGTLDPLASGILPIALGEATKTMPFAVEGSKTYRFTVKWGERTDTLDRGERAYDLARSGEDVQLEARTIHVEALHLLDCPTEDMAVLEMHCGKGAYVRSLARDIAFALGTEGHVAALRRIRVGGFIEAESTRLDVLEEMAHKGAASEALLPVQTALDDIPALAVTEEESFQLKLGRPIVLLPRQAQELKAQRRPREIAGKDCTFTALALCDGVAVALGDARAGKFQPSRVFNLAS